MKNEQKGITLVALVITIIILLILTGITISQLKQNGLFGKTQLAKEKAQNAQLKENQTLKEYANEVNKYINSSRQESNSPKRKVLFDANTDPKGLITAEGIDNEEAKRKLYDDVSKYDAVIVNVYEMDDSLENLVSSTSFMVEKGVYNTIYGYFLSMSTNHNWCRGHIKIDTTENTIVFFWKGYATHAIYQVIGINY